MFFQVARNVAATFKKDRNIIINLFSKPKNWWDLHGNDFLDEETAKKWQEWEWVWWIIPKEQLQNVHNLYMDLVEKKLLQKWLPFMFSDSPPEYPKSVWDETSKNLQDVPEAVRSLLTKNQETIKIVLEQLRRIKVTATRKALEKKEVKTKTFTEENLKVLLQQWELAEWLTENEGTPENITEVTK